MEKVLTCHFDHYSEKLDKKPLIGVEYLLELHDPKMREVLYICTLCDKRCDPRNIFPQITSHSHRIKYLVSEQNLRFKSTLFITLFFLFSILKINKKHIFF
jgi:hypothetical protein